MPFKILHTCDASLVSIESLFKVVSNKNRQIQKKAKDYSIQMFFSGMWFQMGNTNEKVENCERESLGCKNKAF